MNIKLLVMDVDGTLTDGKINMGPNGELFKAFDIKDGYAIQLAVKMGLRIVVMTGGNTPSIRLRYERLGVEDIYMQCAVKIKTYEAFLEKYGLTDEEVIYVGDDIPDYEIMSRCGCPCCPSDACSDIKALSLYVSQCAGGYGCGRDVIEQVLRAQGKWLSSAKAFGW